MYICIYIYIHISVEQPSSPVDQEAKRNRNAPSPKQVHGFLCGISFHLNFSSDFRCSRIIAIILVDILKDTLPFKAAATSSLIRMELRL